MSLTIPSKWILTQWTLSQSVRFIVSLFSLSNFIDRPTLLWLGQNSTIQTSELFGQQQQPEHRNSETQLAANSVNKSPTVKPDTIWSTAPTLTSESPEEGEPDDSAPPTTLPLAILLPPKPQPQALFRSRRKSRQPQPQDQTPHFGSWYGQYHSLQAAYSANFNNETRLFLQAAHSVNSTSTSQQSLFVQSR